jgi:hypothetical protein
MRYTTLLFLSAAAFGLISCETVQTVHHKAPSLPPEIQKAQDEVYDLQYQMYQAQHDLTIAKINEKEQQLESQKNPSSPLINQYSEIISKLELQRSQAESRYGLAQQWYNAVQNGDLDSAKSFQQEMNQ